jgi:hypothetical protein
MDSTSTTQLLLSRHGGNVLIPFIEAAAQIGYAAQSARNLLAAEKFPVETIMRGSRRFVHVADLAEYIDGLRAGSRTKPRRGRPTKASKMAREG